MKQLCKKDDPVNLSSHDALVGKISIFTNKKEDDTDFTETYEVFEPKKIMWGENEEYKNMTTKILSQLLLTYDEPEHLPALAEMSSKMIALCAEKCFKVKQPKHSQPRKAPKFSKALNEAYQTHNRICAEWRKAGRPQSPNNPAKKANFYPREIFKRYHVMKKLTN